MKSKHTRTSGLATIEDLELLSFGGFNGPTLSSTRSQSNENPRTDNLRILSYSQNYNFSPRRTTFDACISRAAGNALLHWRKPMLFSSRSRGYFVDV